MITIWDFQSLKNPYYVTDEKILTQHILACKRSFKDKSTLYKSLKRHYFYQYLKDLKVSRKSVCYNAL